MFVNEKSSQFGKMMIRNRLKRNWCGKLVGLFCWIFVTACANETPKVIHIRIIKCPFDKCDDVSQHCRFYVLMEFIG